MSEVAFSTSVYDIEVPRSGFLLFLVGEVCTYMY